MSNNQHQRGPSTPRSNQRNNQQMPPEVAGEVVPIGTLLYGIFVLGFCVLFNLLYGTGWIDFVKDDFDSSFSTLGIILPITAIVQFLIQIKK